MGKLYLKRYQRNIEKFFNYPSDPGAKEKMAYLSKEAVLNSDGTNIFNLLQQDNKIKNDKVNCTKNDHRLKYIHFIIGNIKNNIGGIYHGIDKSVLPLYLWEQ